MDYSKTKRILLILLCIFVLFFPFWCVAGLCVEENVEDLGIGTTVNSLVISNNSNVFTSGNGAVKYIPIEPGYVYYVVLPDELTTPRQFAVSSDVPSLNSNYDYLGSFNGGDTVYYRPEQNGYLYFSYYSYNSLIKFYRYKVSSQVSAVDDLVANVGPDAIWNIFDTGINYIYIVVLVAFGIFIVTLVIRKITKGKEGF